MALDQVTVYADQIAAQRIGYQAVSLTNFDNDSEPQLAAGSVVEIGGALFEAAALESISGWAGISNDSDVYIKLTVSGSTATAAFTTDPPTWSTSKQGWYDGDDRYIGGLYKDGSGNYAIKWLYPADPGDPLNQEMIREGQTRPLLEKVLEIGDWDMDATENVGPFAAQIPRTNTQFISVTIRADNSDLYDFKAPYATGDFDIGGYWIWSDGFGGLKLYRVNGGRFDSVNFDSTSFNRGWVYIKYRA